MTLATWLVAVLVVGMDVASARQGPAPAGPGASALVQPTPNEGGQEQATSQKKDGADDGGAATRGDQEKN
jgi:hypothetical protein